MTALVYGLGDSIMSDLKCTKCGIERSYADADIADLQKTCGSPREAIVVDVYTGEEHNWVEI